MPLITLTSDWGYKDYYLGAVKGKLYSSIKDLTIVDISHNIGSQDILMGAFIVKNACLRFPPKTIHLVDVDSTETKEKSHIVIEFQDQYYICTDNGLPSSVFENENIRIISIDIHQDSSFFTFAALDLFTKVAALIAYETPFEELGRPQQSLYKRQTLSPFFKDSGILCRVEHVDQYGNIFLNIDEKTFLSYTQGNAFHIRINGEIILSKISQSYDDVPPLCPLLTLASSGNLQIALNGSNASKLLNLRVGDSILIDRKALHY